MSAIIVAGNEIIPDTLTVTVDGTEITAKDFQKVLLNINQASATASVADGTDLMQKMEIINKNANACDVSFKGEGGTTVKNLKQNQSMRLSWTGSFWYVTFGGLLSGIDDSGTPFNYTTEVTLDEAPLNTTYSTTEVDTGMTWIDGKPIYRKVFTVTNQTKNSNESLTINFSANDVDSFIRGYGYLLRDSSGVHLPYSIPSAFAINTSDLVQLCSGIVFNPSNPSAFVLAIGGSLSMSILKVTVIVEYTKTTD